MLASSYDSSEDDDDFSSFVPPCFKCGRKGHVSSVCPSESASSAVDFGDGDGKDNDTTSSSSKLVQSGKATRDALWRHIGADDSEALAALLTKEPWAVNAPLDNAQRTPLHMAIAKHKINVVTTLLAEKGLDINFGAYCDAGVTSPLHLAVDGNHLDIVELIVQHPDVDINCGLVAFPSKQTPVMTAVKQGNLDILKVLLRHPDVNPNEVNADGVTPLAVAIQNAREDLVFTLVRHPDTNVNTTKPTNTAPMSSLFTIQNPVSSSTVTTSTSNTQAATSAKLSTASSATAANAMVVDMVKLPTHSKKKRKSVKQTAAKLTPLTNKETISAAHPLTLCLTSGMQETAKHMVYHPYFQLGSMKSALYQSFIHEAVSQGSAATDVLAVLCNGPHWSPETHHLCSILVQERVKLLALVVSRAFSTGWGGEEEEFGEDGLSAEGDLVPEYLALPHDVLMIVFHSLHVQEGFVSS